MRPMGWTALAMCLVCTVEAGAATFSFSDADVTIAAGDAGTPVGDVRTFSFEVGLTGALVAGASYANPAASTVAYRVQGSLDAGNASGFPAFDLRSADINGGAPPLSGAQFYGNGATLDFAISAGADLSDGLQISEFDLLPDQGYPTPPVEDAGAVFVLNAREDGTGRYHPPLLIFRGDGTGVIMNSNNTGVNGQTGRDIVAEDGLTYGAEYVSLFTFDPERLTVFAAPLAPAQVPGPASAVLLGSALLGAAWVFGRRSAPRG